MSLCRLMVEDFMYDYGIWDTDIIPTPQNRNYDRSNLEFGILYAQGLLEEGFKKEPFYRYNLRGFIKWAKERLKMKIFKKH